MIGVDCKGLVVPALDDGDGDEGWNNVSGKSSSSSSLKLSTDSESSLTKALKRSEKEYMSHVSPSAGFTSLFSVLMDSASTLEIPLDAELQATLSTAIGVCHSISRNLVSFSGVM